MTSHPPSPHCHHDDHPLPLPQCPRQLTQDLLLSVSALVCWARKATDTLSRKVTSKDRCQWDGSGRSPDLTRKRVRPTKRLLSNISSKAISLVTNARRRRRRKEVRDGEEEYEFDFGDSGVWQRTIMMGDKCQPLDFSGVIYYDESGKQLNHIPLRSPRASPLPGYLTRRDDGEVRA